MGPYLGTWSSDLDHVPTSQIVTIGYKSSRGLWQNPSNPYLWVVWNIKLFLALCVVLFVHPTDGPPRQIQITYLEERKKYVVENKSFWSEHKNNNKVDHNGHNYFIFL